MNSSKFGLTLISLALLAACGGGGGGDAVTPPVVPPLPVVNSIVTSVPAPTYSPASEEIAAFNLLNAERGRCGFGLLAQNSSLDIASQGHADWLLINNYTGHYQIAGTQGFTGVYPVERDVSAGYGAVGSFDYSGVQRDAGGAKTGQGTDGVRGLLNAPYHLLAMMRGFRDVGFSVRDRSDVGLSPNNRHAINMDFGYKNAVGLQSAATGSARTYPCLGSTGINRSLNSENPNPAPGRDIRINPIGTSIGVVVDVGKVLVITSASMINVASGASIALRTPITGSNDPNAVGGVTYITNNEGFVSADAPLDAFTQYQATITGTSDGAVFTRTFAFTTGQ